MLIESDNDRTIIEFRFRHKLRNDSALFKFKSFRSSVSRCHYNQYNNTELLFLWFEKFASNIRELCNLYHMTYKPVNDRLLKRKLI